MDYAIRTILIDDGIIMEFYKKTCKLWVFFRLLRSQSQNRLFRIIDAQAKIACVHIKCHIFPIEFQA